MFKQLFIALLVLVTAESTQAQSRSVVLANPEGALIYRVNDTTPMIPASTLKLLTSLAAFTYLGKDYRFVTQAAFEPQSGKLFLKGYGDPLLISEELIRLSSQIISRYSPGSINDIVIDTSFFSPDIDIPGTGQSQNPYDATTGAFCANFNTFHFKWNQELNQYISAEPQTPFLDTLLKDIQGSGLKQGRILLSEKLRPLYPGLLVKKFLEQNGVHVSGKVMTGHFSEASSPELRFASGFSLEQVINKLLTYSNNFIANQLMLAMGAKQYGAPATLDKGVRALQHYAAQELHLQHIALAEGSGISRENRISAAQMIKLLEAFKPYYRLLKQENNDFFKTGTLSDVRTRAGYLIGRDNRLYPYVIMLNSTSKGYENIYNELKRKVAKLASDKG